MTSAKLLADEFMEKAAEELNRWATWFSSIDHQKAGNLYERATYLYQTQELWNEAAEASLGTAYCYLKLKNKRYAALALLDATDYYKSAKDDRHALQCLEGAVRQYKELGMLNEVALYTNDKVLLLDTMQDNFAKFSCTHPYQSLNHFLRVLDKNHPSTTYQQFLTAESSSSTADPPPPPPPRRGTVRFRRLAEFRADKRNSLRDLCQDLGVAAHIVFAPEGITGYLCGMQEHIEVVFDFIPVTVVDQVICEEAIHYEISSSLGAGEVSWDRVQLQVMDELPELENLYTEVQL